MKEDTCSIFYTKGDPFCNPLRGENYRRKKLLAQSLSDLSPVAVKSFDALYLDRMQPGQKVVVCHNASFKVVLPASHPRVREHPDLEICWKFLHTFPLPVMKPVLSGIHCS